MPLGLTFSYRIPDECRSYIHSFHNGQQVSRKSVQLFSQNDCDQKPVLLKVEQKGPHKAALSESLI